MLRGLALQWAANVQVARFVLTSPLVLVHEEPRDRVGEIRTGGKACSDRGLFGANRWMKKAATDLINRDAGEKSKS